MVLKSSDRTLSRVPWDYEVAPRKISFILYRAVDGIIIWSGFVGDKLAVLALIIFLFFNVLVALTRSAALRLLTLLIRPLWI